MRLQVDRNQLIEELRGELREAVKADREQLRQFSIARFEWERTAVAKLREVANLRRNNIAAFREQVGGRYRSDRIEVSVGVAYPAKPEPTAGKYRRAIAALKLVKTDTLSCTPDELDQLRQGKLTVK